MARKKRRAGAQPGEILARFTDRFYAEMKSLPPHVHTVLLSNEHCHSRLRSEDSIRRLKELLDSACSEYKIVVYLRRQDDLAISRYSTALRTGSTDRAILPDIESITPGGYFDYEALLRRWGAVFGADTVVPRLFGREHLVDGDLIADFRVTCGLEALSAPGERVSNNPSLRPAAQEFLLQYNAMKGRWPEAQHLIARALSKHFAGPGRLPSRAAAQRFMQAFEAGNDWVRATYFPERERLFATDFSRYPEKENLADVPPEDVLAVSLKVATALASAHKKPDSKSKADGRAATQTKRERWSRTLADGVHDGNVAGQRTDEAADRTRGSWREAKATTRPERQARIAARREARRQARSAGSLGGTPRREL